MLRRGRSVVIAFADDEETAESVREGFENARAESIDAAMRIGGENYVRLKKQTITLTAGTSGEMK